MIAPRLWMRSRSESADVVAKVQQLRARAWSVRVWGERCQGRRRARNCRVDDALSHAHLAQCPGEWWLRIGPARDVPPESSCAHDRTHCAGATVHVGQMAAG